MTVYLECPICGGTERSLLPESVCEECGCDMKPVTDAQIALNKDAPRDDRIAAMRRLSTVGDAERQIVELRNSAISPPAEAREPVGDALRALERVARDDYPDDATRLRDVDVVWAVLVQLRDTPRDAEDAAVCYCGDPRQEGTHKAWACLLKDGDGFLIATDVPEIGAGPTGEPT